MSLGNVTLAGVTGGTTIFARVSDIAARDALTGMNTGDTVATVTPQITWRYDGSAWQIWDSSEAKTALQNYVDSDIPDDELNPLTTGPNSRITLTTAAQTRNVGYPSAAFDQSDAVYIEVLATVAGLNTIIFDSVYKNNDGTDIGTVAWTSAGTEAKSWVFRRKTIAVAGTDQYWLVGGSEFAIAIPPAENLGQDITQVAHALAVKQAVYFDGTNWLQSRADLGTTVAHGIVTKVTDVNNFTVTTHGPVTVTGHGLTVGEYYWLDASVLGAVTATQPTTGISQSVLFVRTADELFIDIGQAVSVNGATALSRIQVSMLANSNISGLNNADFDEVIYTEGPDLTLNVSGAIDGLKAGNTYKLVGNAHNPGLSTGYTELRFVDLTGLATIGEHWGYVSANDGTNGSSLPTQTTFFTPLVDSSVGVDYVAGAIGEIGVQSTFTVEQVSTSAVVDPNLITPTALHYASSLVSLSSFSGVDAPIQFDVNLDNTGGMITNSTTRTIQQTGKYHIELDVRMDIDETVANARFIYLVRNNVNPVDDAAAAAANVMSDRLYVDGSWIGITQSSMNGTFDLVAGDTLIAYFAAASGNDRVHQASFTVTQVPTSTVVNPDLIVPETLSYASMTRGVSSVDTVNGTDYRLYETSETVSTGWVLDLAAGTITATKDMGFATLNFGSVRTSNSTNNARLELQRNGVGLIIGGGLANAAGDIPSELNWSGAVTNGDVFKVVQVTLTAGTLVSQYKFTAKEEPAFNVVLPDTAPVITAVAADNIVQDVDGVRTLTFRIAGTSSDGALITYPVAFKAGTTPYPISLVGQNARMLGFNTPTLTGFTTHSLDENGSPATVTNLHITVIGETP